MSYFLRVVTLTAILTLLVHLIAIVSFPLFADNKLWQKVSNLGEQRQFNALADFASAEKVLGSVDPTFQHAVCTFDLSEGPVEIRTERVYSFTSLSVHGQDGSTLYSLNDSGFADGYIEFNLRRTAAEDTTVLPIASSSENTTEQEEKVTDQILEVPIDTDLGFVVLKVFVPANSYNEITTAFFNNADCE